MFAYSIKILRPALLGALSVLLCACGAQTADLDTAKHEDILRTDRISPTPEQKITLTLPDALARGVDANLDARVAAMEILSQEGNVTLEKLAALPSLTASRGFVRRNNDGASSSVSVISGLQSLEPSQSTDRLRRVSEVQTSWNLLDAALAMAQAETASEQTKITQERYSKVIQNIERDVYAAYWRAWAFQNTIDTTRALLNESDSQYLHINQAIDKNLLSSDEASEKIALIHDRQRILEELQIGLSQASADLKGLLSIPQTTEIILTKPVDDGRGRKLLQTKIADQELQALKNRPEMREEVLQRNVAIQNTRREVFKTFPGASLLFSYNTDSNSFLQESEWTSLTGNIVQNILNIFTLPARYQAAEAKQDVVDARRQALNAAILAQVHIGRTRLKNSQAVYNHALQAYQNAATRTKVLNAKSKIGQASKADSLLARIDSQVNNLRMQAAHADYQDATAAMINTLGQNLTGGGKGT